VKRTENVKTNSTTEVTAAAAAVAEAAAAGALEQQVVAVEGVIHLRDSCDNGDWHVHWQEADAVESEGTRARLVFDSDESMKVHHCGGGAIYKSCLRGTRAHCSRNGTPPGIPASGSDRPFAPHIFRLVVRYRAHRATALAPIALAATQERPRQRSETLLESSVGAAAEAWHM